MKLNLFLPLTKVDAVQRIVYGTAAVEELDKANEIFDYDSSKPLFEAWSDGIAKASDGKSLGNVRAMHGKVAAGKLNELNFDDVNKAITCAAKIVDDNEWKKVEEGVYTGFSIGGSYAKRWKDGDVHRYTAAPAEISIVDNPCIPSATFTMVKADGVEEQVAFQVPAPAVAVAVAVPAVTDAEKSATPTNDQVAARATLLAKSAGNEALWPTYVEQARTELTKSDETAPAVEPAADATPNVPSADLEQVWKAKDGKTFSKKAEAVAHNETIAKAEAETNDPAAKLQAALGKLQNAVGAPAAGKVHGPDCALQKDVKATCNCEGHPSVPAAASGTPAPAAAEVDSVEQLKADVAKATFVHRKALIKRAEALGAAVELPEAWSATNKEAYSAELKKSLYDIGRLASLISELRWLQQDVTWEESSEEDTASTTAADLKDIMARLCAVLRARVVEETSELFDETDAVTYIEILELADRPEGVGALQKVLQDGDMDKMDEAQKTELTRLTMLLGKVGSKVAAPSEQPENELAKANTEIARLTKAMGDTTSLVETLVTEVEKLKNTPIPGGPAVTEVNRVVDKTHDDAMAAQVVLTELQKSNPDAIATALIRLSQQNPQRAG